MQSAADPYEITCDELKRRLDAGDALQLVDCREKWEHDLVRLPDSALIPMNETPAHIDQYRALEGRIVVYCHHGMRSLNVVSWLRGQGLENVSSLRGGIDAWSQTIDPELPRY